MRSIAILNQKGGVGKTTTAVNLSVGLARKGRRVVLIDMDAQAHATLHFGLNPAELGQSVYDLLMPAERPSAPAQWPAVETPPALKPAPWPMIRSGDDPLWLVPSGIDLAGAEVQLAGMVGREVLLRDRLEAQGESGFQLPDGHTADYLIIDCPPSLGLLTLNALAAVREVFIAVQPHFLALQGLSQLLETVSLVRRRINSDLKVTGVLICMRDTTSSLGKEVEQELETYFDGRAASEAFSDARLFRTRIRRNIKLAECPSYGRHIFDYAPTSHGAEDYAALTAEILGELTVDSIEQTNEDVEQMKKYRCEACGYIYDPEVGDPDADVVPGTAFEALPGEWVCPECGAEKDQFELIEA